ncbi:hypothetical protein OS493_034219 [Desmophyllum pertusum]|uniref:Uncharacterized protein n=1 Tax=Desmophyllum pertusum TaxID=174260 RepID=A0A9W9ZKV6_9CNID|nr:hypothetical protein OS493_034219 [Desmophyllum pertusum]
MWRSKSSSKDLRTDWKGQQQAGKDIIQLYNRETRAQRERNRKIIEIQRKARRKDDSRNYSLEAKAREEMRKNSQAKTGYSVMKLPPIESPDKPPRKGGQRWSKRSSVKDVDEHFLPEIDTSRAVYVRGGRLKEPSRDPRFQGLISCLLINEDYYGDLQRFAPPRREMSKRTRLGLGF